MEDRWVTSEVGVKSFPSEKKSEVIFEKKHEEFESAILSLRLNYWYHRHN